MNKNVPVGYKMTEVGVIPENWKSGILGDFWTLTDCKHITAEFVVRGYPIASIREVQSRCVDLTNAKQTTEYFYNLLIEGGRKPLAGDLILSRNATVGEIAQVTELHPMFAMGQDVCLLRKKSSSYSTEFLQEVFQSQIIINQFSKLMVGSTFKRANVEQIRNFYLPMPPEFEQRSIALVLSDTDALVTSLDKLIAKKRDIKQAAMQQLLTGKQRLEGFSGDWEVKFLSKITSYVGSGKSKINVVNGYSVYGSTGVIGYSDTSDYIGDSILVARVGANAGKLNFVSGQYGVTDNTIIVKLTNVFYLPFFFYQLKLNHYALEVHRFVSD